MKIKFDFKMFGLAVAMGVFSFGCSQETQRETNEVVDETQAEMNEATVETNEEYNEFSTWVTTNSERAETVTEDEYRELRTEYNRRAAEFDAESDNWDEATRREWEETKADWNQFENKVEQRLGKIDDLDVDVDVQRENN